MLLRLYVRFPVERYSIRHDGQALPLPAPLMTCISMSCCRGVLNDRTVTVFYLFCLLSCSVVSRAVAKAAGGRALSAKLR